MSKRRKPGDICRRTPGSGFVISAEPELVQIPEGEIPSICLGLCSDPDCQEWANLKIISSDFLDEYIYHISECCLEDV